MPTTTEETQAARPILGHVNLMVDTLIANATLNDLQAFTRTTLASSPPSVAETFTASARRHLARTTAAELPRIGTLFCQTADGGVWEPTEELFTTLARSRMLYGAGMGVVSLTLLAEVVRSAVGVRWEEDSRMEDILAIIDADITQAIQSAKEEIQSGRVSDIGAVKAVYSGLHDLLVEDKADVERWGGDFPFERAMATVELWKL
ncbi:hypothetical protein OH77DRAFT_246173 [Trametes cingulata]|nr:hypothetical protein OH77DRAFT_246173 [Trametes cingulata]